MLDWRQQNKQKGSGSLKCALRKSSHFVFRAHRRYWACDPDRHSSRIAQKKGGTLRLYHNDNPPTTSLMEESTIASVMPFAAVFNNLVMFDPAKPHESLETVIPDLAESWSWDATNTKLTFKLRQGVKWHDGQPFTAKDVQCTWRMMIGKGDTQDLSATRAKSGTRNCRTSGERRL